MRVLLTGCTSLQINSGNPAAIKKINVPANVAEALRAAGHTVDWRKVDVGDDLSKYDVAWINLAPINSLNGRSGAMGVLWVLSSELPVVAFADDWQINSVFNGMRAVVKRPKMLTKVMLVGLNDRGDEIATHWSAASAEEAMARVLERNPRARVNCERYYMRDTDEQVMPHAERLIQAAHDFSSWRWEQGMVLVCPMYGWGNHNLVRKRFPPTTSEFEALDPSPIIYPILHEHEALPPEEKERGWILGALMPHDDWVKKRTWEWPVHYMGSKTVVRRNGGVRVQTESDVIGEYNKYWGVLSPPYPHAGSGWWRSRFMYAARVRSVLCCDRGEGVPLGPSYMLKHSEIEQLSTDSLFNLAEEQAASLRRFLPGPGAFIAHCDQIVRRAYREDKGGVQTQMDAQLFDVTATTTKDDDSEYLAYRLDESTV